MAKPTPTRGCRMFDLLNLTLENRFGNKTILGVSLHTRHNLIRSPRFTKVKPPRNYLHFILVTSTTRFSLQLRSIRKQSSAHWEHNALRRHAACQNLCILQTTVHEAARRRFRYQGFLRGGGAKHDRRLDKSCKCHARPSVCLSV